MSKGRFVVEILAIILGLLAGAAIAGFDIYVLHNPTIPIQILNVDAVYLVFFQVFLYFYLHTKNIFNNKNLISSTAFFIVASLGGFALTFALVPSSFYMEKFRDAFPTGAVASILRDIALGRLVYSFIVMLLAFGVSKLIKLLQA